MTASTANITIMIAIRVITDMIIPVIAAVLSTEAFVSELSAVGVGEDAVHILHFSGNFATISTVELSLIILTKSLSLAFDRVDWKIASSQLV